MQGWIYKKGPVLLAEGTEPFLTPMDKPAEGPRRGTNDRHPKDAATVLARNRRGLRDRTPDLPNRRSIPCPVHHPASRAGARKLAPLPVWSCGKSTALQVSPLSSKRTNRDHKLGLQVQIGKIASFRTDAWSGDARPLKRQT